MSITLRAFVGLFCALSATACTSNDGQPQGNTDTSGVHGNDSGQGGGAGDGWGSGSDSQGGWNGSDHGDGSSHGGGHQPDGTGGSAGDGSGGADIDDGFVPDGADSHDGSQPDGAGDHDGSQPDGAGDGADGGDGNGNDDSNGGDDGSTNACGRSADLYEPFTNLTWSHELRGGTGSIVVQPDARACDGSVLAMTFPGNEAFGPKDGASPAFAKEITNGEWYSEGKFEVRARFAQCSRHEEVVSGIFTYQHGGDTNQNGLTDNSEIDIEVLCGTPEIFWMTVYTDYEDFAQGKLRKFTRQLDLTTGSYVDLLDFPPQEVGKGVLEGVAIPNFATLEDFYTVGFEWRANFVRYYIVRDGREVDLFTITQADRIPKNPAQFRINIWHADGHWTNGQAADYPANDSTLLIDYVKIWR